MYNCNMLEALSGAFILFSFVCRCVCVYTHTCDICFCVHAVCVFVCAGVFIQVGDRVCYQDTFLNVSPPYILRQDHSFNQKLTVSARLSS